MKRFTQSDLRKVYETPPQDLAAHIHETISSLPVRVQEEKIVKKKLSFSVVFVVILLFMLMATALAVTNDAFNDWLYQWWPEAATAFRPVNLSCEDQGIRMEIVSAVLNTNDDLYVTYSLEDPEQNRISEYTDPEFDIDYDGLPFEDGYLSSALKDPDSSKVFFSVHYIYKTHTDPKARELTASLQYIAPGPETATVDLLPLYRQYAGRAESVSAPENAQAYSCYDAGKTGTLPDSIHVLNNNVPEIPLAKHVTLSGIGMVDGFLHVQFHLTDCPTMQVDNYMYRPVYAYPELYDKDDEDGYMKYLNTSRMIGGIDTVAWGSQPGDPTIPEWLEYIYTVDSDLTDAQVFTANVRLNEPPITGNWKVQIPLRMIRKDQAAD